MQVGGVVCGEPVPEFPALVCGYADHPAGLFACSDAGSLRGLD